MHIYVCLYLSYTYIGIHIYLHISINRERGRILHFKFSNLMTKMHALVLTIGRHREKEIRIPELS